MRAIVLAVVLVAGCYDPRFQQNLPCSETGQCPPGQGCQAGLCVSEQLLPDAPVLLDDGGLPCVGLECMQVGCDGGDTVLTGTVTTPNGGLPLYDVLVYVPNGPVPPMPATASCQRCDGELPAHALVSTRTDVDGFFHLGNMPAASAVPVVIQTGRWRRQLLVDIPACTTTSAVPQLTQMPANRAEGDMPRIAISTGAADALECLIRKIGIDDSELGLEGSASSVHLYAGTGTDQFDAAHGSTLFPAAQTMLWESVASLQQYDMVVLSCPGSSVMPGVDPLAHMKDYVDGGGKVLADHWHDTWLAGGPSPWSGIVEFEPRADLGAIDIDVDQSFPRGQAFAQWLVGVGASETAGSITINDAQDSVAGISSDAQRWLYLDPGPGGTTIQHLSFTAPVGVATSGRCGRFMFSDVHTSSGDTSMSDLQYPSQGCTTPVTSMTPQEKALIYQLFELGRCLDDSGI